MLERRSSLSQLDAIELDSWTQNVIFGDFFSALTCVLRNSMEDYIEVGRSRNGFSPLTFLDGFSVLDSIPQPLDSAR